LKIILFVSFRTSNFTAATWNQNNSAVEPFYQPPTARFLFCKDIIIEPFNHPPTLSLPLSLVFFSFIKKGIMVKGNLRALGSPQHLKQKFGSGYEIIVKMILTAPPDLTAGAAEAAGAAGAAAAEGGAAAAAAAVAATAETEAALLEANIEKVAVFLRALFPSAAVLSVNGE
jgi:hypothetical protein